MELEEALTVFQPLQPGHNFSFVKRPKEKLAKEKRFMPKVTFG